MLILLINKIIRQLEDINVLLIYMDNLVFGLILIAVIISVIMWLFNNNVFRYKLRIYILRFLELDKYLINSDINRTRNKKIKNNRKNTNHDVQIIEDVDITVNTDIPVGDVNDINHINHNDGDNGDNGDNINSEEKKFKKSKKSNDDILDNISIDSISMGSINSDASTNNSLYYTLIKKL